MELLNSVMRWIMKKRIHQIELFMKYPVEVQNEVLSHLMDKAKNTEFGKEHGFKDIHNFKAYKNRVPVTTYETFYPYIDRLLKGEQHILWASEIRWFAKSSGTTTAKSKFIPVSEEALEDCHFKGGKDMLSIYVNNYPDTKIFTGKNLAIGGSQQLNPLDERARSHYGDVSAVLMKNLPIWAQFIRVPSLDIALMDNWEEKIEKMARATADENVISITGVPTWTIPILQRIVEIKGKNNILEVWPNLEVFFHGAVSFTPYRQLFKTLIPSEQMHYLELYNATEGFFGIQDQKDSDAMLLMLDYGIFYEFIPSEDFDKENPQTVDISGVELDKNYAMVISTNSGLWRYKIGDTVKFTSLSPYRFKISGRTKHFINAFGEEVIVENAERAIAVACEKTGATFKDFTAAPRYIDEGNKGCHEWIIEFSTPPQNLEAFTTMLDETLRNINTDYDAKRSQDLVVGRPMIHSVAPGTFYQWMKKRGKLGGQNKVPRLANDRKYLEDLLAMAQIQSENE